MSKNSAMTAEHVTQQIWAAQCFWFFEPRHRAVEILQEISDALDADKRKKYSPIELRGHIGAMRHVIATGNENPKLLKDWGWIRAACLLALDDELRAGRHKGFDDIAETKRAEVKRRRTALAKIGVDGKTDEDLRQALLQRGITAKARTIRRDRAEMKKNDKK